MNTETTLVPENPQEQNTNQPVKLKPLPFNITPATRERFQALFPKSTDQTLNALLDAYEARQNAPAGSESELSTQIAELKKQLETAKNSETTLKDQIEKLKTQPKTDSEDSQKIKDLQSEISEKSQKISDLKKQLSDKDDELSKVKKQMDELPDVQDLMNQINKLQDEKKEDKKLLQGRAAQKEAYEEKIKRLEGEKKNLQDKVNELKELLEAANAGRYTGSDEFLSHFEPIVAELLSMTAEKLTANRKDGVEITPAMILGDMFLKYTLQKRTMWFYTWVLYDEDILAAAQAINPNIQSVRMLRKVLNVDKELN